MKGPDCVDRSGGEYLYYSGHCTTLDCKTDAERVKTVTLEQFMLFMIMPVGGLLMGAFALFITRKDRSDNNKPRHSH
ncbi:hypothetical protein FHS21_001237 [Phyllobacterium trifolii]|jgi:hypothetical protein|uniref:Uncharacterized protein n=1 Tax=Phyllobacterium trifolii TaxID=300193 RepID=A0A839U1K6_9HYPH|nr:hypothetical protein [Phyllobacterium trifolii]